MTARTGGVRARRKNQNGSASDEAAQKTMLNEICRLGPSADLRLNRI